jgi:hypothetical protein
MAGFGGVDPLRSGSCEIWHGATRGPERAMAGALGQGRESFGRQAWGTSTPAVGRRS